MRGTLAALIKKHSKEGAAPIRRLFITTHFGGPRPDLSPLWDPATVKERASNTLDNAIRRIGPVRSWFTRDSEIILLGCHTNVAAEAWAIDVLRGPEARARGTTEFLAVRKVNKFVREGFLTESTNAAANRPIPEPGEPFYRTLNDVLGAPEWQTFLGGK